METLLFLNHCVTALKKSILKESIFITFLKYVSFLNESLCLGKLITCKTYTIFEEDTLFFIVFTLQIEFGGIFYEIN